jgi:hypothetical protein
VTWLNILFMFICLFLITMAVCKKGDEDGEREEYINGKDTF